jgi:hypothetical protein
MALDWLWAALIGSGGAVIGGWVAGRYTVRAASQQFASDREAAREDRSHLAAAALSNEASRMQSAAWAWAKNGDGDAFEAAWFRFQQAVVVQSMVLTDDAVGHRVADYLTVTGSLLNLARERRPDNDLVWAVNRVHDIVQLSLAAHIKGEPLPDYQPPPLNDLAALRRWGTESPELPN